MSGPTPRCFHILRDSAAPGLSWLSSSDPQTLGEVPAPLFAVEGPTRGVTQEEAGKAEGRRVLTSTLLTGMPWSSVSLGVFMHTVVA